MPMFTEQIETSPIGFHYVPDVLSPEEHDILVAWLAGLPYEHDVFRGQRLKRSYAQFGYAYVAIGQRLQPAPPFPDYLVELLGRALAALPEAPGAVTFEQCIVTHYGEGAGIGWHMDAPSFGDYIVGVSAGGDGRFQFRPKGLEGPPTYEAVVTAGSVYAMSGPARWEWQHRVVPVKAVRYSLTFRQVPLERQ